MKLSYRLTSSDKNQVILECRRIFHPKSIIVLDLLELETSTYISQIISLLLFQMIGFLLFWSLFLGLSVSKMGVDLSEALDLGTFQCYIRNGAKFAIVQASTDEGNFYDESIPSLKALKTLGLETDIYIKVCRGKDAAKQVQNILDNIPKTYPGSYYRTAWVYVKQNPSPGCDWSSFPDYANCQYLKDIASVIINQGKNVGFFSSVQDWLLAFRKNSGCSELGDQFPIWYEYDDKSPSLDNYRPFGGWIEPDMKRYSVNYTWCGTDTSSLNYIK